MGTVLHASGKSESLLVTLGLLFFGIALYALGRRLSRAPALRTVNGLPELPAILAWLLVGIATVGASIAGALAASA